LYAGKLAPWQLSVIGFFNRGDARNSDFTGKKKHLFLWGDSNCGKTTFVRDVCLKGLDHSQIYRIGAKMGRYAYAHFDPTWHNVSLNDEFLAPKYNTETLKLAVIS
jgi:GTPase SAR1 family protein